MQRLNLDRAGELLDRIRTVRVLVVGDLMLDVYLRGGASRISPEAPVPVVRVRDEWRALGGAANVAANLEALGAHAAMLGVVGGDAAGRALREEAEAHGIDASGLVELPDRPTTMKTRVLVGHQQVARYDREEDGDLGAEAVALLCDRVEALAAGAAAVVLEDYDKGVLVPSVIDAALDAARRHDIPVVVDPKARHFFGYGGSTVFKPNRGELADALRAPVQPEDAAWMDRTRKHLGCENLLVTLGAGGDGARHRRRRPVARAGRGPRRLRRVWSGRHGRRRDRGHVGGGRNGRGGGAAGHARGRGGSGEGGGGHRRPIGDRGERPRADGCGRVCLSDGIEEARMADITRVYTDAAPQAIGPYSQALKLGNLVFTAGQIALDPGSMQAIEGDVAAQTERVLTSLEAILREAGASLDSVLKTTVYLVDIGDFAAMNEVYGRFFDSHKPARSTVAVAALPKGMKVEIDAIATTA